MQHEPRFAEAVQDPRSTTKRLCKVLENVGFAMTTGRIIISNRPKWISISMIETVSTRLPSASNTLESFHGHGNEQTPRWNDFMPLIVRVAAMMIRKTLAFRTAFEDMFGLMVRKTQKYAKFTDPNILAIKSAHYGTTPGHCRCGETCHKSAMSRNSCPCGHQYSIGAEKLHVQTSSWTWESRRQRQPSFSNLWTGPMGILPQTKSVCDCKIMLSDGSGIFRILRKQRRSRHLFGNIFRPRMVFALGLLVSVFGLINEEISHFHSK
jgi:hypothetical protein